MARISKLQGKEAGHFHYTACGLDDVYLMSGFTLKETPYGKGVAIRNLDQLHTAIGLHFVTHQKDLSGKALRFLRREMDLTQAELGRLLGLSSQQVARWEKSESQISGAADYLLRILFIQHTDGAVNARHLVDILETLEANPQGRHLFTQTRNGWRAAA